MVQDIRGDIVALLNGLSVSHGNSTVAFNAAYWSASAKTPLPAFFVRLIHAEYKTGIDGNVYLADARYDVAIVIQARDAAGGVVGGMEVGEPQVGTQAIEPEALLKSAASAVQSKLKTVMHALGGASGVRVVADRVLPEENLDGILLYQRVLTIRAHSEETP